MKETSSFAGTGWLRGRRRNASLTREPALSPLQRVNSVSNSQRGRTREVGTKTPPRARTWSPKPSGRLETRLGITPTRYAVDELYVGQSPEEEDIEENEDPAADDASAQGSSVSFMEDRRSLYDNMWEESEGLLPEDNNTSSEEASQLVAPNQTPPFRRTLATTNALQTPTPVGLFRRKSESHRRAREIIDKAYSRDCSIPITPCSSSASLNSVNSVSSCVEIFLLLIEPKSKVFELIELSYPRRTTTIAKILKMIPKNVSDPVLAEQKYVGLCRPKKNSEPITELKAYASNSVTASGPTANICQGDIFIALPANTSSRQMIHLAKPIVANPYIQKLMSSPHHQTPKTLKRRTTKDSTCSTSTCASVTPVVDETPVSNTRTPNDKHLVNRDIFCSEEADAYFQYCEQEMKRAVAQANFDNGVTPLRTSRIEHIPPPLVSRDIILDGHETERSSDDAASYEGSAVSSFHSMVHSVSSTKHRPPIVNQRALLTRKRRAARQLRWIRRTMMVLFGVSVLYYLFDSKRLVSEQFQAPRRPLGLMGLLSVMVSFVVLMKLQRFYLIPAQTSMCPVMQAIYVQMNLSGASSSSSFGFN